MKLKEFKNWLENKYVDTPTTVSNRISNCKNIEKYYGDLEIAYVKDKCSSIIDALEYSTEDEREKNPQRHLIPINGNIRNGTATLKQALKLYNAFKEDESRIVDENLDLSIFTDIEHDDFFNILSRFKYESNWHSDIINLQDDIKEYLENQMSHYFWETEHVISENQKDRVDIIGVSKTDDLIYIIELDAHRADQVAKKFVSRMALYENFDVCYTSICYPGTKNMPINETKKYFNYCSILAKALSKKKKKSFIGIILK